MSKWEMVKLGEVCEIVSGTTPKTRRSDYWNGEFNWVTPAEMTEEVDVIFETQRKITATAIKDSGLKILPIGTVLLSSRAPIGKVAITGSEMSSNQGFKNLICSNRILNRYLFWYLKGSTEKLNNLGRGATFKEISKAIVFKIEVPLPPLDIQQHIAKTLDTASELIALYKKQLTELDSLIKAIFYDMFGDPVVNDKGWEVKKLCECSIINLEYGSGASAIDYNGQIRYIRITDINENGDLNQLKVSPSDINEKYFLSDGDILFARSGATVGKVFHYKKCYGDCLYAGYLIRFVPNQKLVLSSFFYHYTNTDFYKKFIEKNMRTVAQPNINAKQYGDLKVTIPPIFLQQKFADTVTKIEEQKETVKKSLAESQYLFDSLMSQYFE